MSSDIYQCILCEEYFDVSKILIDCIKNFNKDKDIYFENNETKEVEIINCCEDCYDSNNECFLSKHVMTNY